jgi:hypothetical protein
VPVLDHLVSISAGFVPAPELYPGAGAAERSQETLYSRSKFVLIDKIGLKFYFESIGDNF